jgi:hypothetical protein
MRWDADQAVDAGQQSMAELLRPGGYIVRVCPAVPFATIAASLSAVCRQPLGVAGRAGTDAEHAEDI